MIPGRAEREYNAWANQRVLDTAARLTPEQYRADGGASFGSFHDTLVHIMSGHLRIGGLRYAIADESML